MSNGNDNNVDVHIRGTVDGSLKGAAAETGSTIADLKESVISKTSQMTGASRELVSAVAGIGPAFLLVGGSVAVMAKAYADGVAEVKAMNLAVAQGGDISGQTASSVRALSSDMASHSRMTIAESKAVATALASSGQIGAGAFNKIAEAAGNYARVMGTDVAKVGPELVKLFDDPAKGAEELNKRMHFLSAAELDHIEHLTRMGDVTAAQIELADKLGDRMGEIAPKLGYVERAWDGVKGAASKAWDAMMGLGREQTTKDRLDAVYSRIKQVEAMGAGARNLPTNRQLPALMQEALRLSDEMDKEQQKVFDKSQAAEKNRQEQSARLLVKRYSVTEQAKEIDDEIALIRKSADAVAGADEAIAKLKEKRAKLFEVKAVKAPVDNTWRDFDRATHEYLTYVETLQKSADKTVRDLQHDYRKGDESRTRAEEADQMTESQQRLAKALDAVNDRARRARESLDLHFPERERQSKRYLDAVAELDGAQRSAAQSAEEWAGRQDRLNASWEYGSAKALRSYLDEVRNVAASSARFVTAGNQSMENSFIKLATTGKIQMRDLFGTMAEEAARALYRKQYAPAVAAGVDGVSSWLGKLLGFGGSGGAGSMSGNGSVQGNSAYVYDLHSGGIAGSGEGSGRKLRPMSMFDGAPKYHGGGLAGDEMPAVLKKGEGVFTRGQMAALGAGGGVQVIVNDQRTTANSAPVSVEQGASGDGMRQIRILIRDEVRGLVGSGQLDASMRASYGTQRTLTKRG